MKRLFERILLILNVIIILAMLVTGFAYHLNPVTFGWLAEAGYAFPFALIANIIMIVVWMIVRPLYVLVPFAAMLLCYVPVSKVFPVNMGDEAPEGSLRVMSYNTWSYGRHTEYCKQSNEQETRHSMLRYIRDCHPDIVCLQEAPTNKWIEDDFKRILPDLRYRSYQEHGIGGQLLLLSRFPIVKSEIIDYESVGNGSAAFTIDVDGHEVVVVNNHLETNAFSFEERDKFNDVVHGNHGKKAMAHESRFVLAKLTAAAKIRSPQAQAVAEYVRRQGDKPVILCGDFNDIPLSYSHYVLSRELTDCYVASGLGPGFSYRHNSMSVRIDNIMCSGHFTPRKCYVDDSVEYSDHYPIFCDMSVDW